MWQWLLCKPLNPKVMGLNPESIYVFFKLVFSAVFFGYSLFQFANVFGLSFCFALDHFWYNYE